MRHERGEDGCFWARESQDNNKGGVGNVLEVVVCGGARRWWPDEGWPAARRGEVKMEMRLLVLGLGLNKEILHFGPST